LLRGLAPVQRVLLAGGVIIIGAILWVFAVLITRHDAQPSGSAGRLIPPHPASEVVSSSQPEPTPERSSERTFERTMEAKVAAILAPMISEDHLRVTVTIERDDISPAPIKRLTAAILVDDAAEGSPPGTRRKRTADELKQIERLASAAIGVNRKRHDVLVVQNIPFQKVALPAVAPLTLAQQVRQVSEQWAAELRYALLIVLFGFNYLAVLRPIQREMVAALRASAERMNLQTVGGKTASTASDAEDIELQTNPAQVAGTLKRHLADQVRSEPSIASHVVRGWIREEV
jgi:flagellar biosynthesis/type III secretory pathway M-ring protein FliF/YscJ